MEKKLPNVFVNKIDKKLDNNDKLFYSALGDNNDRNEKVVENNNYFQVIGENVNQKINSIFNSPRYVYKAKVDITLNSGKITKQVIGKNGIHLITIDNELIPISDIMDIDFSS